MALLTDSKLVTMETLLPYESDLLETSDRERVEVETKIELALSEIRTETETEFERLIRNGSETGFAEPVLGSVVATPSLIRWVCARSLALFYFECYGHQLNARFKEKFEHYRDRTIEDKANFLRRGIGVVQSPLPRPGEAQTLPIAGAIPAGVCYVAYCWANSQGQQSALGEIRALTLPGGQGLQVGHGQAPAGASSWNVFIGASADRLYRQNGSALPLGASWLQSGTYSETDPYTGDGQLPDRFLQPRQIFFRG